MKKSFAHIRMNGRDGLLVDLPDIRLWIRGQTMTRCYETKVSKRGGVRPAIPDRDLNQNIVGRMLGILDKTSKYRSSLNTRPNRLMPSHIR
jgi:hypothetical protein